GAGDRDADRARLCHDRRDRWHLDRRRACGGGYGSQQLKAEATPADLVVMANLGGSESVLGTGRGLSEAQRLGRVADALEKRLRQAADQGEPGHQAEIE